MPANLGVTQALPRSAYGERHNPRRGRTAVKHSALAAGLATGVVVAVMIALTGCAPVVRPHPKSIARPSSTATTAPAPTPSPTASSLGPLPANALFRITATATASDGAVADLVQTVYQPTAQTAADTTLLNSECNYPGVPDLQGNPDWQTQYSSPLFLRTTMTSTLEPGTTAWSTDDTVLFAYAENVSAYSGSYLGFEAYCAPGSLVIPGTVHGVAPVPSSNPAGAPLGWASTVGAYGFDGGGNAQDNTDLGGTAVIGNCAIELNAAATAAGPAIAAWATQPFVAANGCIYLAPGAS
jgi:hypothetical protein